MSTKESSFSVSPHYPRPSPLHPQFPFNSLADLGVFPYTNALSLRAFGELGAVGALAAAAPPPSRNFWPFSLFASSRSLSSLNAITLLVPIALPLVRWRQPLPAFAEVSFGSDRRISSPLLIPYLHVPLVQTSQVD